MPQSSRFEYLGAILRAEPLTEATGPIRLVWLHGWGQSRENLRPLATSLLSAGESWILDLPGHGEAPPPPSAYSPASYALLVEAWLRTLPPCPTIVIGHSLGFRIAVHMALHNPAAIAALVSIAGAGVPRALTVQESARRRYIRLLIGFAKFLRPVVGEGVVVALRRRFGSTDYLAAGEQMRPTFIATVNDNLTALAPQVHQPVLLIYGEQDTETPPDVGQSFKRLFPNAQLHILPNLNHYSIIAGGRHVVEKQVRHFLSNLILPLSQ